MIVVAYGLILPAEILQIPRHGCWNIHASLLPRWRGAAPIQRAIEAGDRESGVCIMQMDEGLDTGPVLHRVNTPLEPEETGGSLHDRLAQLGAVALLDCMHKLARRRPPGRRTPAGIRRHLRKETRKIRSAHRLVRFSDIAGTAHSGLQPLAGRLVHDRG